MKIKVEIEVPDDEHCKFPDGYRCKMCDDECFWCNQYHRVLRTRDEDDKLLKCSQCLDDCKKVEDEE